MRQALPAGGFLREGVYLVRRDRRDFIVMLLIAMCALVPVIAPGCDGAGSSGKVKVAATIVPIADFVKNVGGDRVEVRTLVPPGASPHTFEPTSEQMKFLSGARVLVMNGLHLEEWITDVLGKADNPGMAVVVAGEAVPKSRLLPSEEHCVSCDVEERHAFDPHVWLDPGLAVYEVNAIRDALVRVDPEGREEYISNAEAYVRELKDLDREVASKTSTFTRRKFVALHPAWTYFAKRYGLEQVGVVEERPGKEPSAAWMADLVDTMRESDIEVVFTEPQLSNRAAEVIAKEAGPDVVVRELDPLGDPDNPRVGTYIKLINHDVRVIEEAMR